MTLSGDERGPGRHGRRWFTAAAVLGMLLTGCEDDVDTGASRTEAATGPASPDATDDHREVVRGGLHDCASDLPLADGLTVVETAYSRPTPDTETCVVTLESAQAVPQVAEGLESALHAAGWGYRVPRREDGAWIAHLRDPWCGVVMAMPSEQSRHEEDPGLPTDAETAAFVSLLDCELMASVDPRAPDPAP